MKRVITYILVTFSFLHLAQAQVAKQVNVEKNYTPSVATAQKLAVVPDMTDTVMMRPEVDYTFTPRSYSTSLMTENFQPATIAYWDFVRSRTLYVKAAAGVPFASEADAYVATYRKDRGYAMAYANHWGDYRNRKALDGVTKVSAHTSQLNNRIGGRAGLFVGRRMLEVDVYGNHLLRHRYPTTGERIEFGDVNGKIRIGDDFTNLSRWNFNVEVGGKLYGNRARVQDAGRFNQSNLFAKVAVGKKNFKIHAGFEGAYGQKALAAYKNNIVMAGVRYGFERKRFDFVVGADYYYDKVSDLTSSPHRVFPYLRMMWGNKRQVFAPYLEIDGGIKRHDFAALSYENPYIKPSEELAEMLRETPNETLYNGRFGIGGNVGKGVFSYNIAAELSIAQDHAYWYNNSGTADYLFKLAYQHSLRVNGNIVFRPSGWFLAQVDVGAYVWENYDDFYSSRPNFDLDVRLQYTGRKFSAGVGVEYQGGIKWMTRKEEQTADGVVYDYVATTTRNTINLDVDVEWRINDSWAVFAQGRNLTGGKLYEWLNYYTDSAQCIVGAKFSF